MAGRRKEPINLLVAKGKKHLTKSEIEQRKSEEIQADSNNIITPSYLTAKQKKKFLFYVEELKKIDIIANIDVDALARHVISEIEFEKVSKKLTKTDILSEDYNSLMVYYDKLYKICRQGANDLGLIAMSRCKIKVPKEQEKPVNKFNKFNKFAKNG